MHLGNGNFTLNKNNVGEEHLCWTYFVLLEEKTNAECWRLRFLIDQECGRVLAAGAWEQCKFFNREWLTASARTFVPLVPFICSLNWTTMRSAAGWIPF